MIVTLSLFFYRVGTRLYYLLIYLLSPFNSKASLMVSGRKGMLSKIKLQLNADPRKKIWFHCASLGEFEQARPVLEKVRENDSSVSIVLTFFSSSGYEVRKNYPLAEHIFYLPFDTGRNAKEVLNFMNPSMVFFTKNELWYFYLHTIKQMGIPAYLLSASFSGEPAFLKWYGKLFQSTLGCFKLIFTQDESSVLKLKGAGIQTAVFAGDTRFDRVYEHAKHASPLPVVDQFKGNSFLLVAGSSYQKEEEYVQALLTKYDDLKIVIAPHETEESRIRETLERFRQHKIIRYSETAAKDLQSFNVLVIDNVGLLSSIYQYADLAFVGGGYGSKGLHNLLEPCGFGVPVCFGPNNMEKFPESAEIIRREAGFVVDSPDVLNKEMTLMKDRLYKGKLKTNALTFVSERKGATAKILSNLNL